MKDFIPCRKCKSNGKLPNGFYYKKIQKNGKEYSVVIECDHHKSWIKEKEIFLKYKKAGFKISDFDYDITSYIGNKSRDTIQRIINYTNNFKNTKSIILYCYGNYNSQKTTIINWIGHQILSQGYSVRYILFNELLRILWDGQRNSEYSDLIEYFKTFDLLIIDEAFDKEKASIWASGHQIALVDELIRNRISLEKGIIFCTNVNPDNISKNIHSEAIQNIIFRETKKNNSVLTFLDCLNSINSVPEILF